MSFIHVFSLMVTFFAGATLGVCLKEPHGHIIDNSRWNEKGVVLEEGDSFEVKDGNVYVHRKDGCIQKVLKK